MAASSPILEDDFGPNDDQWPDEPPTLCCECDHAHPDTISKPPYAWRCLKYPAPPFGGFVQPNFRPDPPYHKCQDRNDGACPHWTPKRQANV